MPHYIQLLITRGWSCSYNTKGQILIPLHMLRTILIQCSHWFLQGFLLRRVLLNVAESGWLRGILFPSLPVWPQRKSYSFILPAFLMLCDSWLCTFHWGSLCGKVLLSASKGGRINPLGFVYTQHFWASGSKPPSPDQASQVSTSCASTPKTAVQIALWSFGLCWSLLPSLGFRMSPYFIFC